MASKPQGRIKLLKECVMAREALEQHTQSKHGLSNSRLEVYPDGICPRCEELADNLAIIEGELQTVA